MRKNKIGAIFLVSVFALAGIGISYAGFTDTISIYGTVKTATVQLDIMDDWYSGTWVYKVWGDSQPAQMPPIVFEGATLYYDWDNEILIYRGFTQFVPTDAQVLAWASNNGINAELEASSYAKDGTSHGGNDYDIDFVYDNIFPCIDFSADFIIHYTGSVPAKIDPTIIINTMNEEHWEDQTDATGWLEKLYNYANSDHPDWGIKIEAYRCSPTTDERQRITGWTIDTNDVVGPGYQLHNCNYVYVNVTIHLPQDNMWQGLYGEFSTTIGVTQYYDPCIE